MWCPVTNCSLFDCGAACIGEWMEKGNNRCVFGGTTTDNERSRGPGCLEDDTTSTSEYMSHQLLLKNNLQPLQSQQVLNQ